jgi:LPS sulfotransferase NodH
MLDVMGTLPSIPMGKVTYVVCATPRSGSTLLCALLAGTGVAGRPEEYFECLWRAGAPHQPREYFADVDDAGLLAALAPTEPGAADRSDPFPSALERGTTDNGAFGAKLMWTHLVDLAERLEEPARPALFAERLPELHYVHGTRGDYEAPAADAPAAAGAVLDHVGTGRAEIPEPPLRRQGDDGSARWVERFRGEREAVAR